MIKLKSNTFAPKKKLTLPFEADCPLNSQRRNKIRGGGVKDYVSGDTIGLRAIVVD